MVHFATAVLPSSRHAAYILVQRIELVGVGVAAGYYKFSILLIPPDRHAEA